MRYTQNEGSAQATQHPSWGAWNDPKLRRENRFKYLTLRSSQTNTLKYHLVTCLASDRRGTRCLVRLAIVVGLAVGAVDVYCDAGIAGFCSKRSVFISFLGGGASNLL